METLKEKQNRKEIEFTQLFEVEELEERIEFGKWSAEAGTSTEIPGGATTVSVGVGYRF